MGNHLTYIGEMDSFQTLKYSDSLLLAGGEGSKKDSIQYQQFYDVIDWFFRLKDKTWNIKLLQSTTFELDSLSEWYEYAGTINHWNIDTGDGRFLLDSVESKFDGASTVESYDYEFVRDTSLLTMYDTLDNITMYSVTNPHGVKTITNYDDSYFYVDDTIPLYSNSVVETKLVVRGTDTLNRAEFTYYDTSSVNGYVGQLQSQTSFVYDAEGTILDSISTNYVYVKSFPLPMHNGALKKITDPMGTSTELFYSSHKGASDSANSVADGPGVSSVWDTIIASGDGIIQYELRISGSNGNAFTAAKLWVNDGVAALLAGCSGSCVETDILKVDSGDVIRTESRTHSSDDATVTTKATFYAGEIGEYIADPDGLVDSAYSKTEDPAVSGSDTLIITAKGKLDYRLSIGNSSGSSSTWSKIKINGVTLATITTCSGSCSDSSFVLVDSSDVVIVETSRDVLEDATVIAVGIFREADHTIEQFSYMEYNDNGTVDTLSAFAVGTGPFWTKKITHLAKDSVIQRQLVNHLGLPIYLISMNGAYITFAYDSLFRIERSILPYGFNSGQADSMYSVRYNYDDDLSDGGTSILRLTRSAATSANYLEQTHFDGKFRGYQSEAIGSTDTNKVVLVFDNLDRVLTSIDQAGTEITQQFDNLNRILNSIHPDSVQSDNMIQEIVYTAGSRSTILSGYPFDTAGLGSNVWVNTYYDADNRKGVEIMDELGQLRCIKAYTGSDPYNLYSTTWFDYDNLGKLKAVQKPEGDQVHYVHNSLGQLLKTWSHDQDTILFEYDDIGNMISLKDGILFEMDNPSVSHWQYNNYDEIGRIIESGLKKVYGSDSTINSQIIRNFYDQSLSENSIAKLSLSMSGNNGYQYAEMYDYDARGRLTTQCNYFNAVLDSIEVDTFLHRFEYFIDPATADSFVISFEYNLTDQLVELTYPSGMIVEYEYDDLGRLKSVGDTSNATLYASFSYTSRNELKQMILGDSLQIVDYDYNSRGWLNSINDGVSDTAKHKFGERLYYYNNPFDTTWPDQKNSNIMAQLLSINDASDSTIYGYTYDDLGRIDSVRNFVGDFFVPEESFTYDKNGNRLSVRKMLLDPTTNTYDTTNTGEYTNQLIRREFMGVAIDQYQYDANGSVAWDSSKSADFVYDIYNRLDTVTFIDPAARDNYLEFGYSTSGERIYKRLHTFWMEDCGGPIIPDGPAPGGGGFLLGGGVSTQGVGGPSQCPDSGLAATYYIRGHSHVLAEHSNLTSSVPTNEFIYAGDKRIAIQNVSGELYFYLNDHLGSARLVIDSSGVIRDSTNYTAFGDILNESVSTGQDYKYTGQSQDVALAFNFYYFGARYYDPKIGRFLAIDPFHHRYPSLSPYVFVVNNPLSFVDPNGDIVVFFDQATEEELMKLIENDPELKAQYEELHASEEVYLVQFGEIEGAAQGNFGFDGNQFIITLEREGSSNEYVNQSISTRLAQEFQHGIQFERGEVGFLLYTGATDWVLFSYDIYDEVGGWTISLSAAPNSDFFANGANRSLLGRYSDLKTDEDRANFLLAGPYRNKGFNNIDKFWNDPRSLDHGVQLRSAWTQFENGTVASLKFKLKRK